TYRINEFEEAREDQKTQLLFLHNSVEFQERNIKELEARAQKAEEKLHHALTHSHELEGRLDATKGRESAILQQLLSFQSERDSINEKLDAMQHQLAEAHGREVSSSRQLAKVTAERDSAAENLKDIDVLKRDADLYRGNYSPISYGRQALQERFDEQSVELTATKKLVDDLQEITAELKRDIAHQQEQKGLLETKLNTVLREIDAKTESLTSLRMELSLKEGASQTLLSEEKQRADEAHCQILEMKSRIKSLLAELDEKNRRVQYMERRLTVAEAPCARHEQEVAGLTSRVSELEATKKEMLTKATTITQRYATNDLVNHPYSSYRSYGITAI
ncbi:hypothetical protein ID866_3293, partial [Astraeus odoratus]